MTLKKEKNDIRNKAIIIMIIITAIQVITKM